MLKTQNVDQTQHSRATEEAQVAHGSKENGPNPKIHNGENKIGSQIKTYEPNSDKLGFLIVYPLTIHWKLLFM